MSSLNNIIKNNRGYEIGHISHRKDGDYKKFGNGDWRKIEEGKEGVKAKEEVEYDIQELSEDDAKKVGEYIAKHYTRKAKVEDYIDDLKKDLNKIKSKDETFLDLKKLAYINGNIKKGFGVSLNNEEAELAERGYRLKNEYITKLIKNPSGLNITVDDTKLPEIIYFNNGEDQVSFHLFTPTLKEKVAAQGFKKGVWAKNPKSYLFENKDKAKEFALLTREINVLNKYDKEEELAKEFRYERNKISEITKSAFRLDEKGFEQAENEIRQRLGWAENFVSIEADFYARKVEEAKTPATRKKYEKLLSEQRKIDEMESKDKREKLMSVYGMIKNLKKNYNKRKKEVQIKSEEINKKLKKLIEKRDSIEIRDFV